MRAAILNPLIEKQLRSGQACGTNLLHQNHHKRSLKKQSNLYEIVIGISNKLTMNEKHWNIQQADNEPEEQEEIDGHDMGITMITTDCDDQFCFWTVSNQWR